MKRIGSIAKGQPVYVNDEANEAEVAFAKAYIAHRRGGWRPDGATLADERASERFAERYSLTETVRNGYAGSGEWVFADRTAHLRFRVHATANGSSFWGTDHWIQQVSK